MAEKEEISLVEVYQKIKATLKYLWSKKLSIIVIGVFGGLIGLVYALNKPLKHESQLTFIIENNSGAKNLNGLGSIATSFGLGSIGGEGGLYENQINLTNYLKSRTVLESSYLSLIPGTKVTFAERFVEEYGWRESWTDNKILSKIHFEHGKPRNLFSLQEDSILSEIHKYTISDLLIVQVPEDNGSILGIKYLSIDDTLSRFFPEVLLSVVSHNYTEDKTKLARQNVNLLQHQTDSVRKALDAALINSATANDQVFGLNPAMNIRRVPTTREQIDIQASTTMLEQLIKNLELAKVQLKDKTPLIEIIDKPRFPLERIETSKLNSIIIASILFAFIYILFLIAFRFFKSLELS